MIDFSGGLRRLLEWPAGWAVVDCGNAAALSSEPYRCVHGNVGLCAECQVAE